MYAIHTTPGFIIESRPKGEAGKLLYIFTRELGLVMASAQGIRLEKSKLRYHCQEFTLGEFSFVRGKEFWRLTGAGEAQVTSQKSRISRFELGKVKKSQASSGLHEIIPRMALLLRRLLHGEEAHPELFDHIESSLDFIEKNDAQANLSEEQLKTLESLIVFRIVHLLGYVGNDKGIDEKIISASLCVEILGEAASQRTVLNMHINKALRESQL